MITPQNVFIVVLFVLITVLYIPMVIKMINKPVDCQLNPVDKSQCGAGCGLVNRTVNTPAMNGGAECDMTPYQCMNGDGSCKGRWGDEVPSIACSSTDINLNGGNALTGLTQSECRNKCVNYSPADGEPSCAQIYYRNGGGGGSDTNSRCWLKGAMDLDNSKCGTWAGGSTQQLM